MSKTAVEKQEEIFRHIGWENANGVLLSGLTTADLILQYPSHTKKRQKKKRPVQSIRLKIAEAETVS